MPDNTAANEAKAAANTQSNPASAHSAPASTPPAATPAGGQQQKTPPSALPAEFQGKSAEEIYAAVTGKYSDYDTLKTRASEAEAYTKLGMAPDKIQETVKWVTDVVAGLQGGKQAVYDRQNNRIVFVNAQGRPTGETAAPGQQQQQTEYFDDNYAMLDPKSQAEKLSAYVWEQRLTPEVNKIVQGFDQRFNQAVQQMNARDNIFLEVLDRWIANPKLKPREIMAKVLELQRGAQTGGTNFIDLATNELSRPDDIEAEVERRVAARLAEDEAKRGNANAAPLLSPPVSWQPRGVGADGKPMNRMERRNGLMSKFREQGLLRPN